MNQTDLKHKLSAPFDFNEWKNSKHSASCVFLSKL